MAQLVFEVWKKKWNNAVSWCLLWETQMSVDLSSISHRESFINHQADSGTDSWHSSFPFIFMPTIAYWIKHQGVDVSGRVVKTGFTGKLLLLNKLGPNINIWQPQEDVLLFSLRTVLISQCCILCWWATLSVSQRAPRWSRLVLKRPDFFLPAAVFAPQLLYHRTAVSLFSADTFILICLLVTRKKSRGAFP